MCSNRCVVFAKRERRAVSRARGTTRNERGTLPDVYQNRRRDAVLSLSFPLVRENRTFSWELCVWKDAAAPVPRRAQLEGAKQRERESERKARRHGKESLFPHRRARRTGAHAQSHDALCAKNAEHRGLLCRLCFPKQRERERERERDLSEKHALRLAPNSTSVGEEKKSEPERAVSREDLESLSNDGPKTSSRVACPHLAKRFPRRARLHREKKVRAPLVAKTKETQINTESPSLARRAVRIAHGRGEVALAALRGRDQTRQRDARRAAASQLQHLVRV